ncbi:MAG: hypothetical protein GOV15_01265, partial [Candidatus Diapherotrites archaeon]|nr:hypothetical protein [Candidatus Diapherotrites archaeon]
MVDRPDGVKLIRMSWSDFDKACFALVDLVAQSMADGKLDSVYGIERGGQDVAVRLS